MSCRLPCRTTVFALPLLMALGCSDTLPPMGPDGPLVPQHVLSDGSTDGDFKGFLFLPPLVSNPDKGGQNSIPGLAPHAVVCLLDGAGAACVTGAPYRTFAPSEITYDSDHYKVEWDTKDPAHAPLLLSDPNGIQYTYRLTVFLGSLQLGFVDLQFGANGGTAKNLATDDIVGLNDGRTVPVRFMIGSLLETDLGCVSGLDCQVATFTAGEETTILSRDRQAVLHIPSGATGGTGTIVARIAEIPLALCDLGVNLPTYNSCYEYDLFPKQVLLEPVIVGQCLDTNSVPAGRLGEVQLGARHDNPPAGIPEFELMPNVVAPAGLSCNDYVPAMAATDDGVAAAFKYAVRGVAEFVFGRPAYAGHLGLGGAVRDLSTIAWVDPGLRIAGFSLSRGGLSAITSGAMLPAIQALQATYPNVWVDHAPTLDATLLDGDVDVVLLGSVFGQNAAITALTPAEQGALLDYVERGGCAILLVDNQSFSTLAPTVNQSLIGPFGLSVTGTIGGGVTATVTGSSDAVQGVTSFLQHWPGWFNGIGQGTVQATNPSGPAMVEFAAGALGPHSGPVFAFSDANMFFADNEVGAFTSNKQLFLNTVNACGTEPLP